MFKRKSDPLNTYIYKIPFSSHTSTPSPAPFLTGPHCHKPLKTAPTSQMQKQLSFFLPHFAVHAVLQIRYLVQNSVKSFPRESSEIFVTKLRCSDYKHFVCVCVIHDGWMDGKNKVKKLLHFLLKRSLVQCVVTEL